MEQQLTTFRYYMDIDAADLGAAQIELENRAGNMGSFGDLDVMEIQLPKWDHAELMAHFGIKDRFDMYEKIADHFFDYDAWLCKHCSESVGNDSKEMFEHLQMHTKQELLVTSDGDPFNE